jgi:hypothetical protein
VLHFDLGKIEQKREETKTSELLRRGRKGSRFSQGSYPAQPELKLPQESDRDGPVTLEVALGVEDAFTTKAQSKQHTQGSH